MKEEGKKKGGGGKELTYSSLKRALPANVPAPTEMQFDIHLERAKQREREKQLKYERNRAEHMLREAQRDEAYREAKRVTKYEAPTPKTPQEFIARAEAALARMIDSDNVAAVIFTLKSLGASKGWVEGGASEVDNSKLRELKSFFESVGDKKSANQINAALVSPAKAVIERPPSTDDIYIGVNNEGIGKELSEKITSNSSSSLLQSSASTKAPQGGLDSSPGNTVQRSTNFP